MRTIILLLSFLIVSACFHKTSGPDDQFDVNYLAYDKEENLILQGMLHFTVKEDSTVTGSWEIDWVPGANTSLQVGPQIGSGGLVGYIMEGLLYLDLNPGWADNNVILRGIWSENEMDGAWWWVTFVGPTTYGRFHLEINTIR